MKKNIFLAAILFSGLIASSQDMTKFKLYNPDANAEKEIKEAVEKAKNNGKHMLIQIGGNWCIWCARFNDFTTTDKSIDSLVKDNYVVYHLNYSKENKNEALLAEYGYPQRFGFPVFLILDGKGNLLHTQNSSYLEKDKGYSKENVMGFFYDWSPKALDPKQYKEQ
jgi:thioredoxin-related protein